MAKQTLYMDYSSSKSLQIFLQFLIGNGKINEEMYYYLFGDRDISDDEKNLCLHRHYRNFYKIARNYQTRSLNIDKPSVFFFGKLKEV